MTNYQSVKEQIDKNQEKLRIADNKSLELESLSFDTFNLVNNLKPTLTSKDKYVLNASDKDKILKYIEKVDKTNEEYKNIQTLSYALTSADEELKDNREQIKKLTYSNDALNLRIETLNKNLEKEKEEN